MQSLEYSFVLARVNQNSLAYKNLNFQTILQSLTAFPPISGKLSSQIKLKKENKAENQRL